MAIEVALAIDPAGVGEGLTPAIVLSRLLDIGGKLFSWTPAMEGAPAKARFEFEAEGARDRFALRALKIAGVSLVTSS